jgi:hypothetical protein
MTINEYFTKKLDRCQRRRVMGHDNISAFSLNVELSLQDNNFLLQLNGYLLDLTEISNNSILTVFHLLEQLFLCFRSVNTNGYCNLWLQNGQKF